MLIKLSTPPRLVARVKIFVLAAADIAASRPSLHLKRKHPAKHRHLFCGNLISRMGLQSGIVDACNFSVSGKEIGDFHGVLRMRAHPPRQRAHSAQNQPAIKGRGDSAARYCILRMRWKKSFSTLATTIPPSTSQWPPKYFVVECRTRSAPRSSGRCSVGAQVLSQTQIAPPRGRFSATAARSTIFNSGLDGVSIQASFVFARSAFSTRAQIAHVDETDVESPAPKNFAQ